MNIKNKKYLDEFMKWNELEGNSKAHKTKSKILLSIFFKEYVKDKDFMKLTNKEIENIWLKISKRYTNYFSLISFVKVLRKFIRVRHKIVKGGELPKKYECIKQPKAKLMDERIYSNLKLNKSVKEVFEAVRKAENLRDKFILMVLFDLGLRPHELLKGTIGSFQKTENGYWYFNVDPNTKTGFRKPRCILSVPIIEQFLETLGKDKNTPLLTISLRTLELITQKYLKRSPYVLRRSGITFYYIVFKGNERLLKQRFGTEQFRHYVRMFGSETDDLIDRELGKINNGDNTLKELQPKFCINCGFHSSYDKDNCRICRQPLNINKKVMNDKLDAIAYKSAEELHKIAPNRFEEIANSLGVTLERN